MEFRSRPRCALVCLAALACGVAQAPEERFWSWFAEHAEQLRWLAESRRDPLREELSERLDEVHPALAYEIRGTPGQARQLILSADGVRELFPHVQRLAAAAPELERWEVVAFRPARGLGFAVLFDGFELTPDELWFTAEENGGRFDLRVYVPGVGGHGHRLAVGAARTLLETVLGEYLLGTRVGALAHHPLPVDPESRGLRPLSELPGLLCAGGDTSDRGPSAAPAETPWSAACSSP